MRLEEIDLFFAWMVFCGLVFLLVMAILGPPKAK